MPSEREKMEGWSLEQVTDMLAQTGPGHSVHNSASAEIIRRQSGLSVQEVSRRAQVVNYFIFDVIAGKNSNPSAVKLARIAKVLEVSLDELMNPPEKKESNVRYVKKGVEAPVVNPADIFIKLNKGDKLRPFDDLLQGVFINAVKFCNGNKTQAADGLGMSRSRFYRRMGAQHELLSQKQKK